MSLLNTIGGASSAWAVPVAKAKAFAKADTNADGGIDAAELQTKFDAVAAKTGGTARDASTVIARFDKDGDGSVSRLEIREHLHDLRAASSTVAMAGRKDSVGGA